MNKKNQNNDFKYSRKVYKVSDFSQSSDLFNQKLPDYELPGSHVSVNITELDHNSSLFTTKTEHVIKSSHMKLRSKCRCTINPFDLSSECGDDDFVDYKYTLNCSARHSTPNISSIGTSCTDRVSSSFDLESICWSEADAFPSNDVTNVYDFMTMSESEKKCSQYFQDLQVKKRSFDEELDPNNISSKRPKLTFNYEFRQRYLRGPQKLIKRPSPLPILRDSSSSHVYIPEISYQTIMDLLIGRYSCYLTDFVIIDCRFPYEYEGGHIQDSLNIYTCRQLMQYLIGSSQTDMVDELHLTVELLKLANITSNFDSKAFIFYCEFSSFRGPKLAQCLRGLDRLANSPFHPQFKIPNIYILHGGYMELFGKIPELCTPKGYVSMKQTRYALRSPNNPSITSSSSPTKHCGSPSDIDSSKFLQDITNLATTDKTSTTMYRKQQINCQRQLRSDTKHLSDIVATFTKNSDILRLFKFDEVF